MTWEEAIKAKIVLMSLNRKTVQKMYDDIDFLTSKLGRTDADHVVMRDLLRDVSRDLSSIESNLSALEDFLEGADL